MSKFLRVVNLPLHNDNTVAPSWQTVHIGDIVEFIEREASIWDDSERISVKHLKTHNILHINYEKYRPYYGAYSGKQLLEEI